MTSCDFRFLKRLYKYHLDAVIKADGDDVEDAYHKICVLRSYLLYMLTYPYS